MASKPHSSGSRAVIFGEALWDCFDDGAEVLGGAPFNVAWNLRGFGLDPLFVSRVGADEGGERILAAMREWGLDPSGVEIDPARPTGRVTVRIENGSPSFRIEPDQAYDAVAADVAPGAEAAALYHGTLALRTGPARDALRRLRARVSGPVFLDVNLREPWWTPSSVRDAVAGADWVKLNDDELARLAPPAPAGPGWEERAARWREEHRLAGLIVTRGAEGAALFAPGREPCARPASPVGDLVDTVGAGDAFAAVCLLGLLRGWPDPVTLDRAGRFAARVCSLRGATTRDRSFYERAAAEWRDHVQT